MNVALIDDGVEINNFTIKYIKEFLEICDSNEIIDQVSIVDFCSHGTICAAIINKISPSTNIYSLKILDSNSLSSGISKLERAFKWCLEHDIHIINLSLGTVNSKEFIEIEKWIRRLREKDILVVAAINNDNTYTIPASLPMVIGVSSSKLIDEYNFLQQSNVGIDICAPSNHLIILSNEKEFKTPFCNSYAAPAVTGKICKMYDLVNIYDEQDEYLFANLSETIKQKRENLKLEFRYSMVEYNLNYKSLVDNRIKRKEVIPIISIQCDEKDLSMLNYFFYNDNIFPVKVKGIEALGKIRRKLNKKVIQKISEQMGCDLIVIHNYTDKLGKEDLFIEYSNHKFKLYYRRWFKRFIFEFDNIESVYNKILKLLE